MPYLHRCISIDPGRSRLEIGVIRITCDCWAILVHCTMCKTVLKYLRSLFVLLELGVAKTPRAFDLNKRNTFAF